MDPDSFNAFMSNASKDGLIVPVEPSDLKTVWKMIWKMGEEIQQQRVPNEYIAIDPRMFAKDCSPGANVVALWYRATILGLLEKQTGLFSSETPDDVKDVVFKVAASYPIKMMKPGIVSRGLPQDIQAMLKQMEHELGRLGLESK